MREQTCIPPRLSGASRYSRRVEPGRPPPARHRRRTRTLGIAIGSDGERFRERCARADRDHPQSRTEPGRQLRANIARSVMTWSDPVRARCASRTCSVPRRTSNSRSGKPIPCRRRPCASGARSPAAGAAASRPAPSSRTQASHDRTAGFACRRGDPAVRPARGRSFAGGARAGDDVGADRPPLRVVAVEQRFRAAPCAAPAPASRRGCRRPGCRCSCPGRRSADGCARRRRR